MKTTQETLGGVYATLGTMALTITNSRNTRGLVEQIESIVKQLNEFENDLDKNRWEFDRVVLPNGDSDRGQKLRDDGWEPVMTYRNDSQKQTVKFVRRKKRMKPSIDFIELG